MQRISSEGSVNKYTFHPSPTSYRTINTRINNRKITSSFRDWQENFIDQELKRRKKSQKESFKLISRLNKPRKGSKYIQNTPGYAIECRGVSKWFVNKVAKKYLKVLHDINLKILEGEFVVIVGYSGSGKSTLLNVLSGIERPSNGSVIVEGHNLIALNEKELTIFRKENLSFIFQSYALLPELTARENIMQGAALQENVYRRLDLDELVDLLGVREHLDKNVNQLSGGQQQRIAIVKSVIKNPKILFADEPTAAVDEETSKSILKIFKDINEKYKTTIVLITHNPIISLLADRRIKVESGRIVECVKQRPMKVEDLPWIQAQND